MAGLLRIVIVDDEILIREGLARMLGKESSSFHIVGTYPDGKHLLDELPSLQLDLVITDIRMPQIDGLELIKILKADYPQIRTLLMSGFVEFNYAREAIRSSAVDYLLKPINKEQLFEVLYRLDEERKQLREKEHYQRTGLLLSLLHIEEPSDVLLAGLILPRPYYSIFFLKGRSRDTTEACIEILRQEITASFDALDFKKGLQVLVWYSAHPLSQDELDSIAGLIRAAAAGKSIHTGVSRSYNDTAKLRKAFLEARQACDSGIYQSSPLYYATIEEMSHSEKTSPDPFTPLREQMIHELQILNLPGIQERIDGLFAALKSQQASLELILRVCNLIMETARKELQEFDTFSKPRTDTHTLEEQLGSCMSFEEIKVIFTAFFSAVLLEIRTHRLEMSGTAVETVKRWISANYNQHADLNTLAGMVFLTPSYLSKLFKQETGMTLTDYIIEIRLRKAKQLLKNAPDLKVHEIGAKVGYPDPAYFNKLFKRVVGVTPNEYKRISI